MFMHEQSVSLQSLSTTN